MGANFRATHMLNKAYIISSFNDALDGTPPRISAVDFFSRTIAIYRFIAIPSPVFTLVTGVLIPLGIPFYFL